MVGDIWPSEKRTYRDEKTGALVTQLTNQGINFHLYFTDNSFDPTCENIYFMSNRANPGTEIVQLFEMNLASGIITQLTDDPLGIPKGRVAKSHDSKYMAYISGRQLMLYTVETKEKRVLYQDDEMILSNISFSCDDKMVGFTRNEDVNALPDGGPNYAGFKEKMFAIKDGRVSMIRIDGSGFHDVFRDTHWLSHFQFSPDDPKIAMVCHEGPWNYVHQRIWMIHMDTGEVWPCFRQKEGDCVGHEFWSEGGDVIFDNRRDGHDGTISSTGEQVYAGKASGNNTEVPFFGFAHKDGRMYRRIDMPYYCNHYFGNEDLSLFVGDAAEDIVLIKPEADGSAKIYPLAVHKTTWTYQRSHCHPTFSWDGKKVLFAADTDRWHDNIFLVDVPERL